MSANATIHIRVQKDNIIDTFWIQPSSNYSDCRSGELSLGLLCDIAILIMQATSRLPLGSASSLSVVYLLIDMLVFLPVSYHKI